MKRHCPICSSLSISQHQLALFRRPRCGECGSKVGFNFVFELVFHLFTNMPIALITLFLIFTQGAVIGISAGVFILFTLAYLAAKLAPLDVRGLRKRPADL